MKKILSAMVVLGLVSAFAGPVLAGTPNTKQACEKAHMHWNDALKTCSKGK